MLQNTETGDSFRKQKQVSAIRMKIYPNENLNRNLSYLSQEMHNI